MLDNYYSSFTDPAYIDAKEIHDINRKKILQEHNPRTDDIIALTDHLLLLNAEIGALWQTLRSHDTYSVNVLSIRDYEEEARNWEYFRRNGAIKFWAEQQRRREADWEEAPILAEEHGLADEKWRAERSKYDNTLGPLLKAEDDNFIELQGITKYLMIYLSYKVAKKLDALAPGEERDLKSWMEEMKLMLDYSTKRRMLVM